MIKCLNQKGGSQILAQKSFRSRSQLILISVLLTIFLIVMAGYGHSWKVKAQEAKYQLICEEDFKDGSDEGWDLGKNWRVDEIDDSWVLRGGIIGDISISFQNSRISREQGNLVATQVDIIGWPENYAVFEDCNFGRKPFTLLFDFKMGGVLPDSFDFVANLMSQKTLRRLSFDTIERYGMMIKVLHDQVESGYYRIQSEIFKEIPGERVEFSKSEIPPFNKDAWYKVTISYEDGRFDGSIRAVNSPWDQSELLIEWTDEDPLGPGFLSFEWLEGEVYIDNIEIWAEKDTEENQISGGVYQGEKNDQIQPISDVLVGLFGKDASDEWIQLDAFFTDHSGHYYLSVYDNYEFYALRIKNPEDFISSGVSSIGGTEKENFWIQYTAPLGDKELSNNNFFVLPPTPAQEEPEQYQISGGVYQGDVGDFSQPLPDVKTELYYSDSLTSREIPIGSAYTESDGKYSINVYDIYEYYAIEISIPEGAILSGVSSIGGTEKENFWIQYTAPLGDKELSNNNFFVLPPTPAQEEPEQYQISGGVYQGDVGDFSQPLPDVKTELYYSDSLTSREIPIGSAYTESDGKYSISVYDIYDYYHIRISIPEGYILSGISPIGGEPIDNDSILYTTPLKEKELIGNNFFVLQPTPFPEEPEQYQISGGVYQGDVRDYTQPFPDIEVRVYGKQSNADWNPEPLDKSSTKPNGEYSLKVIDDYDSYAIGIPADFNIYDVSSIGGEKLVDNDGTIWIRYTSPLGDKLLDRNDFFVILPTPTPSPTHIYPFPECPPNEVLLMKEGFDDILPRNWELEPGWRIDNGALIGYEDQSLTRKGIAKAHYPNDTWKHYRVRIHLGALFLEEHSGFQIITLRGEDFRVIAALYPNKAEIIKDAQGNFINIKETELDFDLNLHEIELGSEESKNWLNFNGQTILEWEVFEPTKPGTIEFVALEDTVVIIDAIWVCGSGPIPNRTTVSPATSDSTDEPYPPDDTPKPPSTEPTNGGNGNGSANPLIYLLLLGGITAGIVMLIRFFTRGSDGPTQPSEPVPPVPGLPPIRLINLWLTEGTLGKGKYVKQDKTIIKDNLYNLNVLIQMREKQSRAKSDTADREGRSIQLDVVYFSPNGNFDPLEDRAKTITLPPTGNSPIVHFPIRPRQTGLSRVRVGIYYRNTLLQSAYIDMVVAEKIRSYKNAISRKIDYITNSRFINLEDLSAPVLSIFTNQTPDGTHWIGLFSNRFGSPEWLKQGDVHRFTPEVLKNKAHISREDLHNTAGRKMYKMAYDLPPDDAIKDLREQDLIQLAKSGYSLFDDLFFSTITALEGTRLDSLSKLLSSPGVISIARCREDGTSFPWAMIYSLDLDVDGYQKLRVCPVFMDWIGRNTWQDRTHSLNKFDSMDDPQACLQREDCPRLGDEPSQIVCPFGFWGFMHQLEQPIQQVKPIPIDQIPPEIKNPRHDAASRIQIDSNEKIRIGIATYTGLPQVSLHQTEIQNLVADKAVEINSADTYIEAKNILVEGGRHLIYFYCHGEVHENVFKLKVGSPEKPGGISSAGLNPLKINWPSHPQPIVFLNGCESIAFTPELIHGFIGKFHNLGAAGVIGVEIQNWSEFGRLFAERLFEELFAGRTLGESLLTVRRIFLRQGNPLGLVYSYYGLANLHLHMLDGCQYCETELESATEKEPLQNPSD